MSTELSQGIVKSMGDTQLPATDDLWTQSPTLQVVMLKDIVSNKSGQQSNRKRGAVSDGLHYIQVMFTTQLNDLIDQGKISKYTVIKVKKMTLNVMQEKR
ncbi:hypothetical protein EXIGLDRAFT_765581 [Exidia glandulosa HHB12029]|uniref:Replication factor-A protein 1 N-terminal domain-containing protein n=1 Tax=Exidia glandulosa HHB12029 TaxID=1314781 RepID=A0A165KEC0_EXIGL|nr:hypothetical protein EXIGLDRAFT_765581 [Exidia glandulosa HHB12029]